ncbi:MAG: hypothetical protein EBZ05_09520, partial [Verrucomicrobia bacterium]|nr:hypothetical protein [Verrucomicrobiota bacterium]
MTTQFEKGQIWRTRDGQLMQILSLDSAEPWPIVASFYSAQDKTYDPSLNRTFTKDGYFLDLGAQCDADLVELVKPKAKEFAVGQVWKRANGDYVKITRIADTSNEYPIIATFCDKTVRNIYGDEATYTLDGKCVSGEESKFDLVELVKPEHASAPSPQFKVGQVWESRNGKQFTITNIDDHSAYPIEAISEFCCLRFTSNGNYWDSCYASNHDLIKLISEPEPAPEPIASPPELQAIFNGEKPVYVVVVEDDRGSANKRSVGI